MIAWWRLSHQLDESQAALAELTDERRAVEHRVTLLRPESLDPDMLEERARVMLNFGEPDDRLIIIKNEIVPN
ncbi:MAG: FtsB family cell division protein [Dongiaceae bacterium]